MNRVKILSSALLCWSTSFAMEADNTEGKVLQFTANYSDGKK